MTFDKRRNSNENCIFIRTERYQKKHGFWYYHTREHGFRGPYESKLEAIKRFTEIQEQWIENDYSLLEKAI